MHLNRLGPYEIGKPLGKGGMGSVFEAVDSATGQRVAVKALTPHLAMAEGFRERFEAEIESLKTLRHDGIVRLYGYGEQDGVLFYSMELVEGVSLEDEMKSGRRFTWREVTNIAIQLCSALKHAHDHGIIHRDIKPANILLYSDDKVKLADFGIARLFGTTQLTTAGGVLGTADYMSPEQADGRPVTARCDQYSLGGVMYALLAGRPPFRAKSLPQMLQLQRFAKPEPVRRYAPDTPEELERVVSQLLSKEPADRFPNTQVLARHLQAMYRALSRPASDDFSLVHEADRIDPAHPEWEHSLVSAPTRAETGVEKPLSGKQAEPGDAKRGRATTSPQEVATLAADEISAKIVPILPAGAAPRADEPKQLVPPRPPQFTTVEEEEARRQAEQKRSWLLVLGQLILLAAMLAGMGGLAVYLSRPKTADELYAAIKSEADAEGTQSLATVDAEVEEFLARFPDDPRADEIEQYEERIALDKTERQLQMRARSESLLDPSLLPVETLYLQAVNQIDESPEEAIAMLQSLVDLYRLDATANGTDAPGSGKRAAQLKQNQKKQAACVQLAMRRLAALQADFARQTEQQLMELRERLAAAEQLARTEPAQAAAVYRAIIELYDEKPWAEEVVIAARERLSKIDQED